MERTTSQVTLTVHALLWHETGKSLRERSKPTALITVSVALTCCVDVLATALKLPPQPGRSWGTYGGQLLLPTIFCDLSFLEMSHGEIIEPYGH